MWLRSRLCVWLRCGRVVRVCLPSAGGGGVEDLDRPTAVEVVPGLHLHRQPAQLLLLLGPSGRLDLGPHQRRVRRVDRPRCGVDVNLHLLAVVKRQGGAATREDEVALACRRHLFCYCAAGRREGVSQRGGREGRHHVP